MTSDPLITVDPETLAAALSDTLVKPGNWPLKPELTQLPSLWDGAYYVHRMEEGLLKPFLGQQFDHSTGGTYRRLISPNGEGWSFASGYVSLEAAASDPMDAGGTLFAVVAQLNTTEGGDVYDSRSGAGDGWEMGWNSAIQSNAVVSRIDTGDFSTLVCPLTPKPQLVAMVSRWDGAITKLDISSDGGNRVSDSGILTGAISSSTIPRIGNNQGAANPLSYNAVLLGFVMSSRVWSDEEVEEVLRNPYGMFRPDLAKVTSQGFTPTEPDSYVTADPATLAAAMTDIGMKPERWSFDPALTAHPECHDDMEMLLWLDRGVDLPRNDPNGEVLTRYGSGADSGSYWERVAEGQSWHTNSGSNRCLRFDDTSFLNIDTEDFVVGCRFSVGHANTIITLLSHHNTGNNKGWTLYVNTWNTSDGKIITEFNDGTQKTVASAASKIEDGKFYCAVIARRNGVGYLYLDGELIGSVSCPLSMSNTTPYTSVGAMYAGETNPAFEGPSDIAFAFGGKMTWSDALCREISADAYSLIRPDLRKIIQVEEPLTSEETTAGMPMDPATFAAALADIGVKPGEWPLRHELTAAPWVYDGALVICDARNGSVAPNLVDGSLAEVRGDPVSSKNRYGEVVTFDGNTDEFRYGDMPNLGDQDVTMFAISRRTTTAASGISFLATGTTNAGYRLSWNSAGQIQFVLGGVEVYTLFTVPVSNLDTHAVVVSYNALTSTVEGRLHNLRTGAVSANNASVGAPIVSSGNTITVGLSPPWPTIDAPQEMVGAGFCARAWSDAELDEFILAPLAFLHPDPMKVFGTVIKLPEAEAEEEEPDLYFLTDPATFAAALTEIGTKPGEWPLDLSLIGAEGFWNEPVAVAWLPWSGAKEPRDLLDQIKLFYSGTDFSTVITPNGYGWTPSSSGVGHLGYLAGTLPAGNSGEELCLVLDFIPTSVSGTQTLAGIESSWLLRLESGALWFRSFGSGQELTTGLVAGKRYSLVFNWRAGTDLQASLNGVHLNTWSYTDTSSASNAVRFGSRSSAGSEQFDGSFLGIFARNKVLPKSASTQLSGDTFALIRPDLRKITHLEEPLTSEETAIWTDPATFAAALAGIDDKPDAWPFDPALTEYPEIWDCINKSQVAPGALWPFWENGGDTVRNLVSGSGAGDLGLHSGHVWKPGQGVNNPDTTTRLMEIVSPDPGWWHDAITNHTVFGKITIDDDDATGPYCLWDIGGSGEGIAVYYRNGSQDLLLGVSTATGGDVEAQSSVAYVEGSTISFVGKYEAGAMKLWINGKLVATNSNHTSIGAHADEPGVLSMGGSTMGGTATAGNGFPGTVHVLGATHAAIPDALCEKLSTDATISIRPDLRKISPHVEVSLTSEETTAGVMTDPAIFAAALTDTLVKPPEWNIRPELTKDPSLWDWTVYASDFRSTRNFIDGSVAPFDGTAELGVGDLGECLRLPGTGASLSYPMSKQTARPGSVDEALIATVAVDITGKDATFAALCAHRGSTATFGIWQLYFWGAAGEWAFAVYDGGSWQVGQFTGSSWPGNGLHTFTVYHFHNGAEWAAELYIDGVSQGVVTVGNASPTVSSANFNIGTLNPSVDSEVYGDYFDVRVMRGSKDEMEGLWDRLKVDYHNDIFEAWRPDPMKVFGPIIEVTEEEPPEPPEPPTPTVGNAPLVGMMQPIGPRNLIGGGGLAI